MFYNAESFNQNLIPSVQTRDGVEYVAWDTSNVTKMSGMFQETHKFNGDISNLDTRKVTTIESMFWGARKFNRTIGEKTIPAFNDSDGNELKAEYTAWNTENVSDMGWIFYEADEFNNGSIELDSDTGEYVASSNPGPELYFNTSKVTDMERIFMDAKLFNSPIYRWDTSNVTTFFLAFANCFKFEQEVRTWTIKSDANTSLMFAGIADAGVPFGDKYASSGASTTPPMLFFTLFSGGNETLTMADGTTLSLTYSENNNKIDTNTLRFDNDITNDTDGTIASTNSTKLRDMVELYDASPDLVKSIKDSNNVIMFGEPNTWDVSQVTNMFELFRDTDFNEDISDWDVSNVTYMHSMFRLAKKFNQDISKWNTSKVTNMENMFYNAESFNQNLIPSVQTRDGVEYVAWDTSNVKNMSGMFQETHKFNGDISNLDTRKVTTIASMFWGAQKFNRTIGEKTIPAFNDSDGNELKAEYTAWNTENVYDMGWIFYEADEFNNGSIELDSDTGEYVASSNPGPELYFNTSKVTDMERIFMDAKLFNSPIYRWDTSNVTTFSLAFANCTNFNQEVRTWNMDNYFNGTLNVNQMFAGVTKFTTAGNNIEVTWSDYDAQATPPSSFWKKFEWLYKSYSQSIESTTIDGTVTNTYYYGGIHLIDDTVTPNKNYHIIFDNGTNTDDEPQDNIINLTSTIWELALNQLKTNDSSFDKTKIGKMIIGNNITNIPNDMWNMSPNQDTLHSVTFGSRVKTIGSAAFKNCTNLQSIVIPNWVDSIGSRCFEGCTKLDSLTLPTNNINFTTLNNNLLDGAHNLTSLIIPKFVTTIENSFFANSKLATIYLKWDDTADGVWVKYGFTDENGAIAVPQADREGGSAVIPFATKTNFSGYSTGGLVNLTVISYNNTILL
jgi:surface protein